MPAPQPCPIIHPWETQRALESIRQGTAGGPDGVSARIIKQFSVELATPLTVIFNTSFQQGIVPELWKRALVIPIPKANPPTIDKLRPISLTDHFAKVAEGFIAKWTLQDIGPTLDNNQYGNRKNLSTVHCLINVLHNLYLNAETPKSSSSVVVTDFSKAFDRIDHSIAITKLINLGVRPSIIPWIMDFLRSRLQRVRYKSSLSDWGTIDAGVPQGTRLGPIVFLAMINDFTPPEPIQAYKYVDDLTLIETRQKNGEPCLQLAVDNLCEWSNENNMKLNASKCFHMEITFARQPEIPPAISIDATRLQVVSEIKLLGIYIQSDLKWDKHMNEVVKRANGKLYMLRLLKSHGLPRCDLLTIFQSYVRPVLEYAAPVWHGGITRNQNDKLERIQKRALRIIFGDQYTTYDETLQLISLSTLEERRETLCTTFIKKTMDTTSQFEQFIPAWPANRRTLRSTTKVPELKYKTNRMKNSPLPYLIRLFNSV